MAKTKFCAGISDINDSYMGFLIDEWGVLHNGIELYEGVIPALEQLRGRKKYIILLTNSSQRADVAEKRLTDMGLDRSLYDTIVTAGEMIWHELSRRHEDTEQRNIFQGLGNRCLLISDGDTLPMLEGLDIEITDNPDDADFVLIAGAQDAKKTMKEDFVPLMKHAVRRNLVAYCANPDSKALIGGTYILGPGMLAMNYKSIGGVVHFIGKPHRPIYHYCIQLLQEQEIFPGQAVMIGDTMGHDIMGAAAVEIDTCLVKNGIHKSMFQKATTPAEVDRALRILMAQYNNVMPNYLIETFRWGKALPDRKHKIWKQRKKNKT